MPRASLGYNAPAGNSPVVQFKLPLAEKLAANAALKTGENLSEMIRLSLAREIARRRKHHKTKDTQ